MTILVTEIHAPLDLTKATIVFVADSKVTSNGKHHSQCAKILKVPYLRAAVGFFGLAEINGESTASYLNNFITRNTSITELGKWAHALKDSLAASIGRTVLSANRIGLHFCGFNKDDLPEFWFLTNIPGMEGHLYSAPLPEIAIKEHFLTSDIQAHLENGATNKLKEPMHQVYRNGDPRVHGYATIIDDLIRGLLQHNDFRKPRAVKDYLEIVKMKMEIMCKIYSTLAINSCIGTPIKAFAFNKRKGFIE